MKKDNIVKCATWNVRIIIRKEEELDTLFNEQNNDITVTTGTKNMHQETKETQNCILIYSGANKKAQSQAGLMIWIHNSENPLSI
jgi:hypothetical protein